MKKLTIAGLKKDPLINKLTAKNLELVIANDTLTMENEGLKFILQQVRENKNVKQVHECN
jgi:regulator of replication initiation timing